MAGGFGVWGDSAPDSGGGGAHGQNGLGFWVSALLPLHTSGINGFVHHALVIMLNRIVHNPAAFWASPV